MGGAKAKVPAGEQRFGWWRQRQRCRSIEVKAKAVRVELQLVGVLPGFSGSSESRVVFKAVRSVTVCEDAE